MYDTFVTDDGEFPHHWLCRGKTSTVLVIHVCVMPEKNLERRQSTFLLFPSGRGGVYTYRMPDARHWRTSCQLPDHVE